MYDIIYGVDRMDECPIDFRSESSYAYFLVYDALRRLFDFPWWVKYEDACDTMDELIKRDRSLYEKPAYDTVDAFITLLDGEDVMYDTYYKWTLDDNHPIWSKMFYGQSLSKLRRHDRGSVFLMYSVKKFIDWHHKSGPCAIIPESTAFPLVNRVRAIFGPWWDEGDAKAIYREMLKVLRGCEWQRMEEFHEWLANDQHPIWSRSFFGHSLSTLRNHLDDSPMLLHRMISQP